MADWNPNAPNTFGLEWLPIFGGAISLSAPNVMIATSFNQTISQSTNNIRVPNTGITRRGGIYAVEVYDNETAVGDTTVPLLDAVPSSQVSAGTWVNQAGTNVNAYLSIDEGFPGSTADWIRVTGTASQFYGRLNTGSLALTGKRIVGVKLGAQVTVGVTGIFWLRLVVGGTEFSGLEGLTGPSKPAAQWVYAPTWLYNPATRKPWTIADVQALNTTGGFTVWGQTQAGVWSAVDVFAVTCTVYLVNENRLAVGTLDDTTSSLAVGTNATPAWNTAAMTTPTGGAWTKDGTGRHLYTVRRIGGTGVMNMPFLDTLPSGDAGGLSGVPGAFSLGNSWDVQVDPTFGIATAMLGGTTRIHPFIQQTASVDSVDSLPYTQDVSASVYSGRTAEGEFTGAAGNYGICRFWCYRPAGSPATLDVKIRRRSDNAQLGGTFSLTAANFDANAQKTTSTIANGYGWGLMQVQLPSAATLAAVQYYVEFSSTQPLASGGWAVVAAGSAGAGQTATFDGATDAATVNGVAENTSLDLLFTIATIPTAPATLTAALGSQPVDATVNCLSAIQRADLSWNATALGGAFRRYEIERSEDGGATWLDIATIAVEATTTFKDYEARRGVPATYRIRVVRTDNAFSPWTTSGTMTKPLTSTGYLGLTGGGGAAVTPDSVPLSVTLDIDIRVRAQSIDWYHPTFQFLASKRYSGGTAYGYGLFLNNSGLYFSWSQNGAAINDVSVALPTGMTGTWWLRATRVKKSGIVTFYLAPDSETEPTAWTQLGSTAVSLANTAINDGTDSLVAGALDPNGTLGFIGKIYRVIVYDGIGGDPYLRTDSVGTGSAQGSQSPTTNLSTAGDIDIRVRVALDLWNNPGFGALAGVSNGSNAGWNFYVDSGGAPVFRYWAAGPTDVIIGTVNLGFAPESAHWLRVTRDATAGIVTFYHAPDSTEEPTTWTQYQSTGGWTAPMITTNALLTIASCPGLLGPADSKFYRVIVRDGLDASGIVVADFDPREAVKVGVTTGTLYTDTRRGITYATTGANVAVRGIPVANPDFTNPEARGTYWPRGLSDTAGNVWTVSGNAAANWMKDDHGDNAMFLVSNYDPTLNLAYEYQPVKDYDFNEAGEQQLQGAYGRDYRLAANPLENRGVTARWTFLVGVDDKVPSGGGFGWNAYTPLRNLACAAIPYVCVLDHHGNRMYAALNVPSGNQDTSGGADRYLAEVSGSEVVGVPFVVAV